MLFNVQKVIAICESGGEEKTSLDESCRAWSLHLVNVAPSCFPVTCMVLSKRQHQVCQPISRCISWKYGCLESENADVAAPVWWITWWFLDKVAISDIFNDIGVAGHASTPIVAASNLHVLDYTLHLSGNYSGCPTFFVSLSLRYSCQLPPMLPLCMNGMWAE